MTDKAFRYPYAKEYVEAYRRGRVNPVDVAERFLTAVKRAESADPGLSAFIAISTEDVLTQARASAERYRRDDPMGPLDGVPVAVKDEFDLRGYPTTVGTSFLGQEPAADDAVPVQRLRNAGALLLGKTNMHEIGLGITGINPHHGAARNPHRTTQMSGGSSSGNGVAVAAGLAPIAVSADGGGSIRIPAALCGVVGLKPTFGRVSARGAYPLCWSLGHVGPIAASVDDAALALSLMAGADLLEPTTIGQPPFVLDQRSDVEGLRIGWCEAWAARAESEVRSCCEQAVAQLVDRGAERVELELQWLDELSIVQMVTIGCENAASQYENRREHQRDYGADTRLLLELASKVPAVDYIRAQRLRSLIRETFVQAFGKVHVLATPTTATVAPTIPEEALSKGLSDDGVIDALTAFAFPANLTGLPAISVPVGFENGLPVGLQLMAPHWREDRLLRVGRALEQLSEGVRPEVYFQLLD